MLTRINNPWYKRIAPIFRDARGRAGDLTAFILTLKGVYQVPLKTVGGTLAAITAVIPGIFFLKKMKNNDIDPQNTPEQIPKSSVSSTAQIMAHSAQQSSRPTSIVKYLDCTIGFLGQFGTHHMEMMIASATLNYEFVDYEWLTNPKNFAMLAYMIHAFYHSTQVFWERKASYENYLESNSIQNSSATPLTTVSSTLFNEKNKIADNPALEIKIEKALS